MPYDHYEHEPKIIVVRMPFSQRSNRQGASSVRYGVGSLSWRGRYMAIVIALGCQNLGGCDGDSTHAPRGVVSDAVVGEGSDTGSENRVLYEAIQVRLDAPRSGQTFALGQPVLCRGEICGSAGSGVEKCRLLIEFTVGRGKRRVLVGSVAAPLRKISENQYSFDMTLEGSILPRKPGFYTLRALCVGMDPPAAPRGRNEPGEFPLATCDLEIRP
jgi:hypothetical protein